MSLFKAYNLVRTEAFDVEQAKQDFINIVDTISLANDATRDDVCALVSIYAGISVDYLVEVATSLEDDPEMSATMKFMNSYVAEAIHMASLHYYHKEGTFSIIDKAVQAALDNDGLVTMAEVDAFLEEIEVSYEPTPEELEAMRVMEEAAEEEAAAEAEAE